MSEKQYTFEAETERLLELLTHSIYSNKDVFLRELISNSSDAIDKARIKALTDTNYLWENYNFEIKIDIQKNQKTITISDNWVGMTKDELIKNLWTIAASWTKDFIEKLKESKTENSLIWQFWVWFYSVFMIASKVEVLSLSNESDTWYTWTSRGKASFEIVENDKKDRWTTIIIHIKEEEKDYLEEWKIKELIKKYSNYVWVPIMMLETENEDNKTTRKYEQINESKAIWNKNKSEIIPEEYEKFYSSISYDFAKPLWYVHINTEWTTSYKSILFIPQEKNMFNNFDDPNKDYGPKLFVQNVLILENTKDLLPVWLRFVSWVVQTNDIPLNISREMLQSNPILDKIKKSLVKKILEKLKYELKENEENYNKFLLNYSKTLKEWIYYDNENKENIAWVLKFKTLLENNDITLDKYIENIKEEQKNIYYITAKSTQEALANPYIEQFKNKNINVIILTDNIDEWIVQTLTEYKEIKLVSITSENLDLWETPEEKEKIEDVKKEFKDLFELAKNIIWNDKIEEVKVSTRLWDNLRALASKSWQITPQMEKMMKAMGQEAPKTKRILEINTKNPLIIKMMEEFKKDIKSEKLKDMILYTYEQSLLLEWWELEDYKWFINRINKFVSNY